MDKQDELAGLDEWVVAQQTKLRKGMDTYLLSGGDTEAPVYRQQLGQHQAFSRIRSYLHGSRAALTAAIGEDIGGGRG